MKVVKSKGEPICRVIARGMPYVFERNRGACIPSSEVHAPQTPMHPDPFPALCARPHFRDVIMLRAWISTLIYGSLHLFPSSCSCFPCPLLIHNLSNTLTLSLPSVCARPFSWHDGVRIGILTQGIRSSQVSLTHVAEFQRVQCQLAKHDAPTHPDPFPPLRVCAHFLCVNMLTMWILS